MSRCPRSIWGGWLTLDGVVGGGSREDRPAAVDGFVKRTRSTPRRVSRPGDPGTGVVDQLQQAECVVIRSQHIACLQKRHLSAGTITGYHRSVFAGNPYIHGISACGLSGRSSAGQFGGYLPLYTYTRGGGPQYPRPRQRVVQRHVTGQTSSSVHDACVIFRSDPGPEDITGEIGEIGEIQIPSGRGWIDHSSWGFETSWAWEEQCPGLGGRAVCYGAWELSVGTAMPSSDFYYNS